MGWILFSAEEAKHSQTRSVSERLIRMERLAGLPEPNENTWWGLHLEGEQRDIVQALKIVLTRGDFDILEFEILHTQEARELLEKIVAQSSEWRLFWMGTRSPLAESHLEILPHLKRGTTIYLSELHERLVPLLRSIVTNRHNFNLYFFGVNPRVLQALYQDQRHVSLRIGEADEATSIPLPPLATKHLQLLDCYLNEFSYQLFPEWVRQAAQLESLRSFGVSLKIDPSMIDISKSIQALSKWIGCSSCHLSEFFIVSSNNNILSLEDSVVLMSAIGKNRSITELSISGLNDALHWPTDVLSHLSKSLVSRLEITTKHSQIASKYEAHLFDWLVQMRSTHLVTIEGYWTDEKLGSKIKIVSSIHKHWRRWQSSHKEEDNQPLGLAAGSRFVCTLPRCFWAKELEQLHVISNESSEHPELGLDACYYLLQHWLATGVSEIPLNVSKLREEDIGREPKRTRV